jgi:multidrug efflux pump
MIMVSTIVFGVIAAQRIGISQMPDVDFPSISVDVTREGAAPEVMEKDVVDVLEDALAQVEGIKSITSKSQYGSAQLSIDLDLSRDVDMALQEVQTRIAQAQRNLPSDLDPPVVSKTNPEDQPIMWIAVSGARPRQFITDTARYRVKDKLQTVPGVGDIMLGGYVDRNVRLWLDAERLDQHGLTVADVAQALQREHIELPAGRLESEQREMDVRVLGEALSLGELRRLVLREDASSVVRLQDVALVEDGFADIRSVGRANGETAQGLGIRKQRGANTVAVAQGVRKALEQIEKELPEGLNVRVTFDSSRFVEQSVTDIEHELMFAVLLTAIVCLWFLGSLSSSFNVVLAIPMSLLGTLAVIYFAGFTLNTFTLLALSLAVGIVVDDAIMVMENVYRHAEGGKSPVQAAIEGTNQIKFAAFAASAAVCAIFLPVVFMAGIIGKFFFQFGVTLSVAVAFSYVEAITLAPARCAQLLARPKRKASIIARTSEHLFALLTRGYGAVLSRGLKRPGLVLMATIALMVVSVQVFRSLPSEMIPSQDQGRLMLRFQTAVGSNLEETDKAMRRAEAFVLAQPEVTRSFFVTGGFGGRNVNTGVAFITLVPRDDRKAGIVEIGARFRKEFGSYPGLRTVVQDLSQQGFTAKRGFPVEFSVRGNDWEALIVEAKRLQQGLAESGKVVDVDTDYQLGMPELRVEPDRARAADLGVRSEDIGVTLNALIGGSRIARFSLDGRRVDVRMRLLAEQRSRPESLGVLKVRTSSGELVPLSSLVTQSERPAAQSITRMDRERAISVYANIAPGSSQDQALAEVARLSKDVTPGTRVVLGGASVAFQESMSSLTFALVLGLLVAYMILAAQFNSLLHPITVLTILPLSVAGAAFALYWSGQTLNIFSMVGLLLLMGIVKKNSIILVDYANRVMSGTADDWVEGKTSGGQSQPMDATRAMNIAGPVRLRPILMTSIATMMAAVPSALGLGEGSETRVPMATAVIGGVFVSTALSLLVVPAFYVVADRWSRRVKGVVRRKAGASPARAGE